MLTSRFMLPLAALLGLGSGGFAAPPDSLFEKKVRPVLVEKCASCHGAEKQKGGLRVDSRAALLRGGDRGPAIVPGKPGESLLLRVLAHDGEVKMPPKSKLPPAEIAAVAEWVQAGAPWPDSGEAAVAPKSAERVFTPEEKAFWAFQPVRRPAVPPVRDPRVPIRNDIDRFLLAKLSDNGLSFALPADRRTLLRRVTFDLTGLPPSPAEIEAYLNDDSPDAYEKVVERLLASPAYGEKWGRRWLDVARYADSNGMDENLAYVNAWRYRDYVIGSVNADKPYDRFVREQIAGDLLPGPESERAERLIATGFLVIGPKMLAEDDPMKMRMDIIDEQLDATGQAFLGLTLGCARCHDHKFDPIAQSDYYGLAGIFYSTKSMKNHSVVASWNERPLGTPASAAALAEHEKAVAAARVEAANAAKPALTATAGVPLALGSASDLRQRLAALEKSRPAVDEAMAVEDGPSEHLRIHLRGNHTTLGPVAPRGFPRIMAGDNPLPLAPNRSGRLEFAEWLTRPDHPLTARVMVNRLWAGHFGTGLVRTPDNFGRLGERPSHPELLDWLAAEFVRSGWSAKHMHRLIVTSSAYRTSSRPDAAALVKDPENRLLSHFNRRRLDAEEVRDGMLAVSGMLDRTMGGTLLKATPRQYVTGTANRNYEGYTVPRRSVYLPVIRSAVYDVLQTLDFPDPSVPNGQRAATTIPTQALFMMNGTLADQTAEAFAKSILTAEGNDAARVREAYRRAFGRAPAAVELDAVLAYLKKSEAAGLDLNPDQRRLRTWRGLCRVLLASNEFVFVE